jgi:large subunit ribosomal protein L9
MDVILLDKVENLGNLGDVVTVKPGYGRNFLLPAGRAIPATEANRKVFDERRTELEKAAAEALAAAERRRDAIQELAIVTIAQRAGDEGKLFGSVGTADIADAVTGAGAELHKHEVRMPTGALRQTGSYDIDVHLHPEVNATVSIEIVAE